MAEPTHETTDPLTGARLRSATHEDYDAVMAIPVDHFSGNDYLPHLYHQLLHEPKTYAYLAELDNKVVTFMMMTFDDEDTTLVVFGARTLPEYEGRGLLQSTYLYSRWQLMYKYKAMKMKRIISMAPDRAERNKYLQMTVRRHWAVYMYRISSDNIEKESRSKSKLPVELLSVSDAGQVLTDQTNLETLFKEGVFSVDAHWFPLTVSEKNMKMTARRYRIFADKSQSFPLCKSLTIVCSIQGVRNDINCTLFHHCCDNTDLVCHVDKALSYTKSISKKEYINMILLVPRMSVGGQFKDYLRSIGASRLDIGTEDAFILERPLINDVPPE